jgi:hypothetical protein
MNQPVARTPKRKNAHRATPKDAPRDKCTLLLDADTSLKLTVAAHLRQMDRSEFVNELLADALRHVVISLRGQGQSPVSASPAVAVESDDQAEAA